MILLDNIFSLTSLTGGGGFCERIMKSIKELLRKTLGKDLLSFKEMMNILSETGLILDHRLLTYIHNELKEP